MLDRFIRNYELQIITKRGTITVKPEIRIVFNVTKTIYGDPNTATINIYNLNETNRAILVKDEDLYLKDDKNYMKIVLKVGYKTLETIFSGDVTKASSVRDRVDIITTIEATDGLLSLQDTHINKVVKSEPRQQIIKELKTIKQGKIAEQKKKNKRNVVLVGSPTLLLSDLLEENEAFFIDDGVIHILDDKNVLTDYIPLVSSETGLIDTPSRQNNDIIFQTTLNPLIKLGCLINLQSKYDKRRNGIYKVYAIETNGDFNGSNWKQEVKAISCVDYKVLK